MLRRHLSALALITRTPSLVYRVRQYFGLGSGPLLVELSRSRLCHADIVLCLIRLNTLRARQVVEALIRKPIEIGPACRFVWPDNRQSPLARRQPVITWICGDFAVRRKTRLASLSGEFRVGRTLSQLQSRGVTRGDLRRAMRQGLVRMAGDL